MIIINQTVIRAASGMKFKAAIFPKVHNDDLVKPIVITTGHKLVSAPGTRPAETFICPRLELDPIFCALVNKPLSVIVFVAFVDLEVLAFGATAVALQAPEALVPLLLPAVSRLPVHLPHLTSFLKLAIGAGLRPTKALFG
jgi:hypothetical protein